MKVGDLVRLADGVTIGTIIEDALPGRDRKDSFLVLFCGQPHWLLTAQIMGVISESR